MSSAFNAKIRPPKWNVYLLFLEKKVFKQFKLIIKYRIKFIFLNVCSEYPEPRRTAAKCKRFQNRTMYILIITRFQFDRTWILMAQSVNVMIRSMCSRGMYLLLLLSFLIYLIFSKL